MERGSGLLVDMAVYGMLHEQGWRVLPVETSSILSVVYFVIDRLGILTLKQHFRLPFLLPYLTFTFSPSTITPQNMFKFDFGVVSSQA